jgi:replication factor A3
MDAKVSAPRITAPYLDSFNGHHVTLVGKVTQLRGDQAIVDADGAVTLILNRDAHLTNGHAVQVVGKVNPDLSIKVLSAQDLGSDVDLSLYAAVVEATHRCKQIFVFDQ